MNYSMELPGAAPREEYSPGQWYDHFYSSLKSPAQQEYYHAVERYYNVIYSFLPKDQIQGKIYDYLRVPNIFGKIVKSRLRKIKAGEKKGPRLNIQRKSSFSSNGKSGVNKRSRPEFRAKRPTEANTSLNDEASACNASDLTSSTANNVRPPMTLPSNVSDYEVQPTSSDNERSSKKVGSATTPQYFSAKDLPEALKSSKETSVNNLLCPVRRIARVNPETSESEDDNAYDTGIISPSDRSQAQTPEMSQANTFPSDELPASDANNLKSTNELEECNGRPLPCDDSDLKLPPSLPEDERQYKKVSFASTPEYFPYKDLSSEASNSSNKSSVIDSFRPTNSIARVDPEHSESDDDNAYDTGMMSPSDYSQPQTPAPMDVDSHDESETPAKNYAIACKTLDGSKIPEEPASSQEMFSQDVQPTESQPNTNSQSSSSMEIFETSVVLDTNHPEASRIVTDLLRAMLDRHKEQVLANPERTQDNNLQAIRSKLNGVSSKKINFQDITNMKGLGVSRQEGPRLKTGGNNFGISFTEKPSASFEFLSASMANLLSSETMLKTNLVSTGDPLQNSEQSDSEKNETSEPKSASGVQAASEATCDVGLLDSAQDSQQSNAGSGSPLLNPFVEERRQDNSSLTFESHNTSLMWNGSGNMDEAQLLFTESDLSSSDRPKTRELTFSRFPLKTAEKNLGFGKRHIDGVQLEPKSRGRSKFSSFLRYKKHDVSRHRSALDLRASYDGSQFRKTATQGHHWSLDSSNSASGFPESSNRSPQSFSLSEHSGRFESSRNQSDHSSQTPASSNALQSERLSGSKFLFREHSAKFLVDSDDDDKENRPPNFESSTPPFGRQPFENSYSEYFDSLCQGSSAEYTQGYTSGPSQC